MCAARVRAELRGMGLDVEADAAGNLLARLPGRAERSVLLCAHLDTVDAGGPIEPVLVDGGWVNAQRGDPRRRQQGGGRRDARGRAARAVEGAPVGLELLFTVGEENALRGRQGLRRRRGCAADFGYVFDHATPIGEVVDRLADLLPARRRLPRPRRACGPPAGGRPQRDRSPPRTRSRRMPLGRMDDADDRQRRLDPRRRRLDQRRRRSAAGCSPRRARSIPTRSRRVVARMVDAVHDGAAARASATSTSSSRSCSTATAQKPRGAGRRRRRGRAARLRLRAARGSPPAAARTPTRWRRTGFPCVNLANGTERNHEPTERVSVAALEGMLDVALALLDEAARRDPAMSSPLRARSSAPRRSTRASSSPSASGTLPPRGRRGGRARDRRATRARSASSPTTASGCGSCASRARRSATPDLLELPAGKLDEEGEDAAGDRQARARRGDRQGRRALGAPRRRSTRRRASPTRRSTSSSPPASRDAPGPRPTRTSASRSSRGRWPTLDAIDRRDAGRQDADRALLMAGCRARPEPRLNGALHAAGAARRGGGESRRPWPSRPSPSTASRSSTCCSTSSPTSSSSAACRATRSRPTAPTCSSSARGSRARAATRSTLDHARARRLPRRARRPAATAGRRRRPRRCSARSPACAPSTATCAARTLSTDDPTAHLRAPRQSRRLPQVLTPRRGRRAARASRAGTEPAALRDRALLELDVRLRAARLGGDRPRGRRPRPRGRRPARPRQGLQGAARAGRLGRRRARSPPTCSAAARGSSATAGRRGCSSTSAAAASPARGSTRSSSATPQPPGWRRR